VHENPRITAVTKIAPYVYIQTGQTVQPHSGTAEEPTGGKLDTKDTCVTVERCEAQNGVFWSQ
jgi:hypothetical protein